MGAANSCSYKEDFYDARADPATTPTWKTAALPIACGGIHDGSSWGALSGIHVNPPTHLGTYDGSWGRNGYVYVRAVAFNCNNNNGGCSSRRTCQILGAFRTCGPCPSGWLDDGPARCKLTPQKSCADVKTKDPAAQNGEYEIIP